MLLAGDKVGVIVNNLGGTSNLEMGVLINDTVRHLGVCVCVLSCSGGVLYIKMMELYVEYVVSLQLMTIRWMWCVWSLEHSQHH